MEDVNIELLQRTATRHPDLKLRERAGLELVKAYSAENDAVALEFIANKNSNYMPLVKEEAGLHLVALYSETNILAGIMDISEGEYMDVVKVFSRQRADELKKLLLDTEKISEADALNLERIARKQDDPDREKAGRMLVRYYTNARKAGKLREMAGDEKPTENGGLPEKIKELAWQNAKACVMCLATEKDMETVLKEYGRFISSAPMRKSRKSRVVPFPGKKTRTA